MVKLINADSKKLYVDEVDLSVSTSTGHIIHYVKHYPEDTPSIVVDKYGFIFGHFNDNTDYCFNETFHDPKFKEDFKLVEFYVFEYNEDRVYATHFYKSENNFMLILDIHDFVNPELNRIGIYEY